MTKFKKMTKFVSATVLFIFVIFIIFFISSVFSGRLILPQTFKIGFLVLHYYGLIMALAVGAALYLALNRAAKFGIEEKIAEDIVFWLIIGGFIGARLYHVFSSAGYYFLHPIDIFKVWNGGLSIYGAVFGGIVTLIILKKLLTTHYPLLTTLDWLAPSVVLGQIIGRFGNLFNYELFGYPTNLPWKMFVPSVFRPQNFTAAFFHPWFLYEAVGNLFLLIFLLKLGKPSRPGRVVFYYLLLYNVLRFALEFLRIDSTFIGFIRLNALISLIVAALAGAWILNSVKNESKIS